MKCYDDPKGGVMNHKLTPQEEYVIVHKGTEAPFSGEYHALFSPGFYVCRRCGAPLYKSEDKFDAGCGWPSFDDELPGSVRREADADGRRTEILCARCGAHLGHVFTGERLTAKNTRHCVNSVSLRFIPREKTETAVFAGGCFWGVEHLMQDVPGVLEILPGYTGGHTPHPSYEDVCSGHTGHAEAVQIVFDPECVSYETLAKLFFEIHDPAQSGGQGPDVGEQYRSEIFYTSEAQRETARRLVRILEAKGVPVVTRVTQAGLFWPAEDYHRRYYARKGTEPYCHRRVKRF